MVRAEFPGGKIGGVCMYYKDHLPVTRRDYLCTLQECLVTEIKSEGKSCFFTSLYRSPSQTHDQIEDFYKILDLLLASINDLNPYCSVFTGDFNGGTLIKIVRKD